MKYSMLGDANNAGPVRLSDVYDSNVGGASAGVAASQKALYEAYNSLNSSIPVIKIAEYSKTISFSGQTNQLIHQVSSGSGWYGLSILVTSYNGTNSIITPFMTGQGAVYVRTYGSASNAYVALRLVISDHGGWPE